MSAHSFDAQSGELGPGHALVSTVDAGPAPCLGTCLATLARPLEGMPIFLFAMPFGVAAAAEIAVHARSGKVVVSSRGFGGFGTVSATLRVFAPTYDTGGVAKLEPVQTIACGPNPRHILFVSGLGAGDVLLVSVVGRVDAFDMSDGGVLAPRRPAQFAGELAKRELCAVGVK